MFPELPKNEHSFTLDLVGETTGHHYQGVFQVKCILTMAEKHTVELEKTRLLADYTNPTQQLSALAIIMATLRGRIVDAPEWWKQSDRGNKLMDENVLGELYDRCVEAEETWKKSISKKAEEATKGN